MNHDSSSFCAILCEFRMENGSHSTFTIMLLHICSFVIPLVDIVKRLSIRGGESTVKSGTHYA